MSREVTEAHYLHERTGLEAVLRPPVAQPLALAWIPRKEELLVATRAGQLVKVDPVMGTTTIADDLGEAAVLSLHSDRKRYLIVNRRGHLQVGTLQGETLFRARHTYLGGMSGFFASEYIVLVGDEADGRYLQIYSASGQRKGRVKIPKRVVASFDPETKKILLFRSTEAGLEVCAFGKKTRFARDIRTTNHRLMSSRDKILGFTATGIALWTHTISQPKSMRLPDLSAGDVNKAGVYLGLGTKTGAVALARIDKLEKRVRPDLVRAFDGPVTSVAFSERGRWLATGAEGLRIWSWED